MKKGTLLTLAMMLFVVATVFSAPQTKCPVTGNDIDKSIFMDIGSKRVYFANEACIETFISNMNDMMPEFEKNNIELDDVPGYAQASIKKETTKPQGPLSKCSHSGTTAHQCESTKHNGGVLLKTTATTKSEAKGCCSSKTTTPEAKSHSCSGHADGKGCTHSDGTKCDKTCTHSADGKTCTKADGTKCDKNCDHSKEGCCSDSKGKTKESKAGCCSGSKTTSAGKCSH
jgi:hypothetical protein